MKKQASTTLELVSFVHGMDDRELLDSTVQAINASAADIILFCGHTIGFVDDVELLQGLIRNRKSEVVFELKNIKSAKLSNCLYRVSKGKVSSMHTNQLFSTSSEIEGNVQLGARLLHEFESRRIFAVLGLRFLVMQCGELNILKNIQSQGNKPVFRLSEDKSLHRTFKKVLSSIDVVLNPIHTPMGNQAKMEQRRKFLSAKGRYYFSVSNTKPESANLELKSLQFAFCNGNPIEQEERKFGDYYISRSYQIRV